MEQEILRLDNQLCFRLYAVSRKMTRLYQPLLQQFGLTYPQYVVMLVLFEHKIIDFNDLSGIVELKTGTLTPILNKLEEFGFIQKEKNPQDGRKINIILSDKGYKLSHEIIKVPLELASQMEITEEMYHVLTKELDSLSSILDNAKKVKNKGEIK